MAEAAGLRRSSFRRVRTPTVLQLETAECGAAALAMVLAYHGCRLPLEELRLACGVSRDGSKASSLLKAARAYGLEAKGLKAEPDHLDDLRPPMIAFVNFCHFVVVEGVSAGHVHLNDPAQGRVRVTRDEFDAMFTGVVLVFAPTRSFHRRDTRPSIARSLMRRTRGFRAAISFVILASLALIVPGIALPVFSRAFVDYVLVRGLDGWLGPLLLGLLATAVLRFILRELQDWHLARAETRLAISGASEMFDHILKLPIAFFGVRYSGEIVSRLNLSDNLAHLLTGQIAQTCLSIITAVFFFVAMCLVNVPLALGVLALGIANVVVLAMLTRSLSDGHRKLSIEEGRLSGMVLAGLQDIETYKAAGAESAFFTRWMGLHAAVVTTRQAMGLRLALLGSTPVLMTTLSTALVLTFGGLAVMDGTMTIGLLVAFQTLTASFSAPLISLFDLGLSLQEVRSYTERVDDVLRQEPDRLGDDPSSPIRLDRLPAGRLRLDKVSFGYLPLEEPLICDLDLSVEPGSRIALVGASGSGKSTVGRLIAGLCEPRDGAVMLDGRPLYDWPKVARSAVLAYVDQSTMLFECSVRENLVLWNQAIPEHDIIAAARDAMIHDTISQRPGAYGATVAEGGRNFSGGQRQRLEIARALAGNPRILVLDEATSGLDAETEASIMTNLRRRGCTLVIIAHRLSTVRDCDEIIVLDKGTPVERGSHQTLVGLGGHYARLIGN